MPAPLTYASVCSGIEAAHLALTPLGFNAKWFSDTDRAIKLRLNRFQPQHKSHSKWANAYQARTTAIFQKFCALTPVNSNNRTPNCVLSRPR